MARKAGLDLALDFTKFIIALDGALIAFLTGASFLQTLNGPGQRGVAILTLCALGLSMVAGILVYMRAATMASEGRYDLGDPHLRWPGVVNVLAFLIGSFALGSLTLFQVGATPASSKKDGPSIIVNSSVPDCSAEPSPPQPTKHLKCRSPHSPHPPTSPLPSPQ
jgi:hypothetical protein